LNKAGQLGVGERCVNADSQGVKLVVCRLGSVEGPWEYDEVQFKEKKCCAEFIT
jgi:polypeptide N-acetylgalactosaminyltransferase